MSFVIRFQVRGPELQVLREAQHVDQAYGAIGQKRATFEVLHGHLLQQLLTQFLDAVAVFGKTSAQPACDQRLVPTLHSC